MPSSTVLQVTSERERDECLQRFPKLSSLVVAAPQEATHVPGNGVLRLGYVGRVEPNRGIANLLEAVDLVRKDGIAVRLRIAGSGERHYEQLLRNQIETLGADRGGD